MPTKIVGLFESLTAKFVEEITGALLPFAALSSVKDLTSFFTAANVCLFTPELFGIFLRNEHGGHENDDCGGTAYDVASLGFWI